MAAPTPFRQKTYIPLTQGEGSSYVMQPAELGFLGEMLDREAAARAAAAKARQDKAAKVKAEISDAANRDKEFIQRESYNAGFDQAYNSALSGDEIGYRNGMQRIRKGRELDAFSKAQFEKYSEAKDNTAKAGTEYPSGVFDVAGADSRVDLSYYGQDGNNVMAEYKYDPINDPENYSLRNMAANFVNKLEAKKNQNTKEVLARGGKEYVTTTNIDKSSFKKIVVDDEGNFVTIDARENTPEGQAFKDELVESFFNEYPIYNNKVNYEYANVLKQDMDRIYNTAKAGGAIPEYMQEAFDARGYLNMDEKEGKEQLLKDAISGSVFIGEEMKYEDGLKEFAWKSMLPFDKSERTRKVTRQETAEGRARGKASGEGNVLSSNINTFDTRDSIIKNTYERLPIALSQFNYQKKQEGIIYPINFDKEFPASIGGMSLQTESGKGILIDFSNSRNIEYDDTQEELGGLRVNEIEKRPIPLDNEEEKVFTLNSIEIGLTDDTDRLIMLEREDEINSAGDYFEDILDQVEQKKMSLKDAQNKLQKMSINIFGRGITKSNKLKATMRLTDQNISALNRQYSLSLPKGMQNDIIQGKDFDVRDIVDYLAAKNPQSDAAQMINSANQLGLTFKYNNKTGDIEIVKTNKF